MEAAAHRPADGFEEKAVQTESCSDACKEFMSSASVHGLSHIVSGKTRAQRILWLLLVLAALSYVTSLSYSSITTYIQRPTMTRMVLQQEDRTVFPAVTICDLNPLNRKKLSQLNDTRYLKAANLLYPVFENGTRNETEVPEVSGEEIADMFTRYGLSLKNVFVGCYWKGTACSVANFTTTLLPGMGKCYTFNGGRSKS